MLNPGDGKDLVLVEKWSVLLYKYERGGVYVLRQAYRHTKETAQ